MKNTTKLMVALMLVAAGLFLFGPSVYAQSADSLKGFIDLNGDGFNDNAADADGDGIPNGLDEDWVKKAEDGDGYKHQNKNGNLTQNAYKFENQNMVQARHMMFAERRAMIQGESSENKLGTLGVDMGKGTFNPGVGAGPHAEGAVDAPQNGTGGK